MYNLAIKRNSDLIECEYYHEFKNKSVIKTINNCDVDKLLIDSKYSVCNKLIRSIIIKEHKLFFPSGLRYEDFEFVCKLVPYIKRADFINTSLYHYIQRENSTCHSHTERVRDIFAVLNNIIFFYKNNGLYEIYKEKLEYVCLREILGASFFRIVKIKNNLLRKELLKENWVYLNNMFSDWKKNSILHTKNDIKNIFFRTVNLITYRSYSILFNKILISFSLYK
jgi:hypothetical protein